MSLQNCLHDTITKNILSSFFENLVPVEPNSKLSVSIVENGILSPIIVWKDKLLIDGQQRLLIARDLKINDIPMVMLQDMVDLESAIECRLLSLKGRLTLIQRIKVIQFFHSHLDITRVTLINRFLPLLDFSSQEHIFRQCLKVMELPSEILSFCEEKKFSLKQAYQLTRFSTALLDSFSTRFSMFSFSASVFIECMDGVHDYLRKHKIEVASFWGNKALLQLLEASKTEAERTLTFRNYLKSLLLPTLIEQNKIITNLAAKLPKGISIKWDPALENKEVQISIISRSKEDLKKQLTTLSNDQEMDTVSSIIDSL
ncbi:hypothetical protein DID80_01515 [Candidatus Marinamargulisbacteria bacterium SCGC AAA071-K20]|nr:hypothetical protein DID80_01515 [Candidatus Marinamargulisbacteria bacterium SCGC AAA071-K20]